MILNGDVNHPLLVTNVTAWNLRYENNPSTADSVTPLGVERCSDSMVSIKAEERVKAGQETREDNADQKDLEHHHQINHPHKKLLSYPGSHHEIRPSSEKKGKAGRNPITAYLHPQWCPAQEIWAKEPVLWAVMMQAYWFP